MARAKRKKEPETPEQRPTQLYLYLGVVETGNLRVDVCW